MIKKLPAQDGPTGTTWHRYGKGGTEYPEVHFIGDTNMADMEILLARPVIDRITGIFQDGPRARVEVLIGYTRTSIYSKIVEIINKCRLNEQACPADARHYLLWNDRWAEVQSVPAGETRHYEFYRYDDGWRLADK